MLRSALFAVIVCALAGCGAPKASDVAKAARDIQAASDAAGEFTKKLDFLHVLPRKECGEPERNFEARLVPDLEVGLGCTGIARDSTDTDDSLHLRFPDKGCTFAGHEITGALSVSMNEGDDRQDVKVDLSELATDGHAVPGKGGYSECGDDSSYWAELSGRLPGGHDRTFHLKGGYDALDGIPVIGLGNDGVNAEGSVTTGGGENHVVLDGVVTDIVGVTLPKHGEMVIDTESDAHLHVKFQDERIDQQFAEVSAQFEGEQEPVAFSIGLVGDGE